MIDGTAEVAAIHLVRIVRLVVENGLRELKMPLLSLKNTLPRKLSVPGLVRISMRPKPSRSYSAENGFWLMRISRMDSLGGRLPPLNPSI